LTADGLDETSPHDSPAPSHGAPPALTASKLEVETLKVKKIKVKTLRIGYRHME
jgi:hypothetical protein